MPNAVPFTLPVPTDELNLAVKMFQNTMMRLRYSAIPVVSAPKALSLGGACEGSMHAEPL